MKGFLLFVFAVVILVGAFGFYRGWFTVHEERIRDDTNKAIERVKPDEGN